MNRKQIQLDFGHLPVEQLPDDVKQFVAKDQELQAWFQDNHWLNGLLDLKRAEQPAAAVVDRIQHRVETRLANARPAELAELAVTVETTASPKGSRRWATMLLGNDSSLPGNHKDTASSSIFAKFATPVTIAAGMAVGLYAVHLMYSDPGAQPLVPATPDSSFVTSPTSPGGIDGGVGELLFTNEIRQAVPPDLTPAKAGPSLNGGGFIRAVNPQP